MKWLVVCDPSVTVEDYGEILPGVPSAKETAGCPVGWRAVYLEADIDEVKPLSEMEERVCRVRPVWEEQRLSPAELLLLGRRVEMEREARKRKENPPTPEEGKDAD